MHVGNMVRFDSPQRMRGEEKRLEHNLRTPARKMPPFHGCWSCLTSLSRPVIIKRLQLQCYCNNH